MRTLAEMFEEVGPKLLAWELSQEAETLANGYPLSPDALKIAAHIGVKHPERVRFKPYEVLPKPEDPEIMSYLMAYAFPILPYIRTLIPYRIDRVSIPEPRGEREFYDGRLAASYGFAIQVFA